MAAHNADHILRTVAGQEILHRVAHRMVMQGAGDRDPQVSALLALLQIIGIHPRIETAPERLRPRRIETFIQALRVVQTAVEHVVNHTHPRQDQVRSHPLLHRRGQLAPHEHAVHEIRLRRVLRHLVEINVLEGIMDHQLGPDGRRGQILDPAHVDIRVMLHSSVLTLTPSAARARRTCEGFSNRMARIPTASAPATFFGTSSINTPSSRFSPYRSSRHS